MAKFNVGDRVTTPDGGGYGIAPDVVGTVTNNLFNYNVDIVSHGAMQNLYFRERELELYREALPTVDKAVDMVAQPPHYTAYEGFEVIEIVEQLDYLRGTAVKYIMRAGQKWDAVEDIAKAIWYLERYKGKLEANND